MASIERAPRGGGFTQRRVSGMVNDQVVVSHCGTPLNCGLTLPGPLFFRAPCSADHYQQQSVADTRLFEPLAATYGPVGVVEHLILTCQRTLTRIYVYLGSGQKLLEVFALTPNRDLILFST
jgi:hypothetical protein